MHTGSTVRNVKQRYIYMKQGYIGKKREFSRTINAWSAAPWQRNENNCSRKEGRLTSCRRLCYSSPELSWTNFTTPEQNYLESTKNETYFWAIELSYIILKQRNYLYNFSNCIILNHSRVARFLVGTLSRTDKLS